MVRHQHASTASRAGTRVRLAGAALLVVAALPLAGCQTGTADPSATPAPTETTASPSPSPSPSIEATPSPSATPAQADATGTTTIDTPATGAMVAGPTVTVSGTGTAFEATLLYLVSDADGASVREGFTTAGANGEIGPFSFEVTLDPGTYTVEVWEPGMGENDAAAPPLNQAQVTFTVS